MILQSWYLITSLNILWFFIYRLKNQDDFIVQYSTNFIDVTNKLIFDRNIFVYNFYIEFVRIFEVCFFI